MTFAQMHLCNYAEVQTQLSRGPEILTVAHTKGGAGKSTLASNLGFVLAARGLRVLLIDLDKQCGQTTLLGLAGPRTDRLTRQPIDSGAVLRGMARLPAAILRDVHPGLDVLPGHEGSLARASEELAIEGPAGQVRLYEVLFDATDWDVILLDTPGTQSPLLTIALTASTGVIIPAIPEAGPVAELRTVLDHIRSIAEVTDASAVRGVVRMRVGGNATYRAIAETRIRELCEEYGVPLLRNKIPEDAKLGEAQLAGLPVGAYLPGSRSAIGFRYLGEELANALGFADGEVPAVAAAMLDDPGPMPSRSGGPGAPRGPGGPGPADEPSPGFGLPRQREPVAPWPG